MPMRQLSQIQQRLTLQPSERKGERGKASVSQTWSQAWRQAKRLSLTKSGRASAMTSGSFSAGKGFAVLW